MLSAGRRDRRDCFFARRSGRRTAPPSFSALKLPPLLHARLLALLPAFSCTASTPIRRSTAFQTRVSCTSREQVVSRVAKPQTGGNEGQISPLLRTRRRGTRRKGRRKEKGESPTRSLPSAALPSKKCSWRRSLQTLCLSFSPSYHSAVKQSCRSLTPAPPPTRDLPSPPFGTRLLRLPSHPRAPYAPTPQARRSFPPVSALHQPTMLFKSFLFSAFLLTAASAHAADSSPLAKIALEKRAAAPVGSTTVIKTCKKAGTFALTFDDGPVSRLWPVRGCTRWEGELITRPICVLAARAGGADCLPPQQEQEQGFLLCQRRQLQV